MRIITKVLFTTVVAASIYGCGGDSDSSSSGQVVAVIEDPTVTYCRDTYGIDADSGWSESISAGSYLEKMVRDKVSERMNYMLSFYARCVSADYNKSKNRFDIEIITERGYNHLWADVKDCKYKLGVEDNYQFNGFVADAPEWSFDECYCKTEDSVAYYRNADLSALGQSSSSQSVESSSSAKDASSSSAKSSSSRKAVSSSSEFVFEDGDFVKIGTQEWMTRNLNIPMDRTRCYEDDESNCDERGRLYTWAQAMGIDQKYDTQELGFLITPYRGICPEGTHLPTREEWMTLEEYLKDHPEYTTYFTNQIGGFYWYEGYYKNGDYETLFWSASEYDVSGTTYKFEYAWLWAFRKNGSIDKNNAHKIVAANVRCLKGDGGVLVIPSSSSEAESSSSESEPSSSDTESSSSNSVYDPDLETVKIGDQVWTTRNLNIPMDGARCFDDDPANCEKKGRLYTWSMAMQVDAKYDAEQLGEIVLPYRGICPEGSHLPTREEWKKLSEYLRQHPEYTDYFINQIGGFYWYEGYYKNGDYETLFWSASEYDVSGTTYEFEFAWLWAFRNNGTIDNDNSHKITAASVRCIIDEESLIENN